MSSIKGIQLLKKTTGLKPKLPQKQRAIIPKEAASYDFVKVKMKGILTDIFTFRDDSGKMIQRYIKKVERGKITETTRKYSELESFEIPVDDIGSEYVFVNSRRIRSYTKTDGKISEIKEEVITHTDEKNPYMTKTVRSVKPEKPDLLFDYKPNLESISIEQRRKGLSPVFIKNKYLVDNLVIGDAVLQKSVTSSPKLKAIANNSFFLPYTSPDVKFVHRIAQACITDGKIIRPPKIKLYKKAGKTFGQYGGSDDTVSINLMTKEGKMEPRTSLVNVVGHEVGHAKWEKKIMRLKELARSGDFRTLLEEFSPQELAYVTEYRRALRHYTSPEKNYSKYYNNFAEVMARNEGSRASQKYIDLDTLINDFFRFLHPNQFYIPKFENIREESLYEWFSKLGIK